MKTSYKNDHVSWNVNYYLYEKIQKLISWFDNLFNMTSWNTNHTATIKKSTDHKQVVINNK